MKFTHTTLVVLSTFVAIVASAPAQVESVTVAETAHILEHIPAEVLDVEDQQEEDTSLASPLLRRGNNYCSPTGRDHCNFWMSNSVPIGGTDWQRWWGVYNYNCDKIGGSDKALSPFTNQYSLGSQLPWTIELTITGGGFTPNGYFWYAGRKTDLGSNMYCEGCSSVLAGRCCRVAFKCH